MKDGENGHKDVLCYRGDCYLGRYERNVKVNSWVEFKLEEFDLDQGWKGTMAREVAAIGNTRCETGREAGIVKEWDSQGYGQIQPDGCGDNEWIRVSIGDLYEPSQTLKPGDRVQFDKKQGNTSIYASYVTLEGNEVYQCTICGGVGHMGYQCSQNSSENYAATSNVDTCQSNDNGTQFAV